MQILKGGEYHPFFMTVCEFLCRFKKRIFKNQQNMYGMKYLFSIIGVCPHRSEIELLKPNLPPKKRTPSGVLFFYQSVTISSFR